MRSIFAKQDAYRLSKLGLTYHTAGLEDRNASGQPSPRADRGERNPVLRERRQAVPDGEPGRRLAIAGDIFRWNRNGPPREGPFDAQDRLLSDVDSRGLRGELL